MGKSERITTPLRTNKLWVRYVILALIFTTLFQLAYNYIQYYAPINQEQRDAFFLQFFILLASTNLFSLVVAIDYARLASPSITIFDKAAFVLGRIFEHQELKGLTEEQAAQKITSMLDAFHSLRPTLARLEKVDPKHIERAITLFNTILKASEKVDDGQLGRLVGHRVERMLNEVKE